MFVRLLPVLITMLLLTSTLGERLRMHRPTNSQIKAACQRSRGVPCGLFTIDCCRPGTCVSSFFK